MKSADIKLDGVYAVATWGRKAHEPLGKTSAYKATVLEIGCEHHPSYTLRTDGIRVVRDGEKPKEYIVLPQKILATWDEYEQAVKDFKQKKLLAAQQASDVHAQKRVYYKKIRDALEAKGITAGHESGQYTYTEFSNGDTSLRISKGAVAKLLGIEKEEV